MVFARSLLVGAAVAASTLEASCEQDVTTSGRNDVHARTMTYWATATNICGDPRSDRHGRADTTCVACCAKNRTDPDRAFCCQARNSTPGSSDWEARMAMLSAHRDNLTGLIPCSHAIGPGGKIISDYSDNYANWRPYLPRVKAMGLKLYAFLGNVGGQGSLAAAMKRRNDFFAEAIAFAKQNQYDGYSSDEELRGKADEKSWEGLERFAPDYMSFMNGFADALHKENLTLTVFIAGCCGWKDPNTTDPAGHCADAVATHDFCGATCLDWRNSSVDWVLSGATYSGAMRNSPSNPRGVESLKALVSNAAHVIGTPKYGIGMKGGLSWNGTSTPFGEPDRQMIEWWHKQGVKHVAKFMDEPRSQGEWDMWGYHLHGP